MTTATEPQHVLTIDRVLDAPVGNVWRCWAKSALMQQWFCPKPWSVSDVRLELKPGGAFSFVMHGPDGQQFENNGVVLDVEPGRRIVTTDAFLPGWIPSARAFMAAEVVMEDAGQGKTHYVARAMHWNEETLREHEAMGFHEGWGKTADQLEALAASLS